MVVERLSRSSKLMLMPLDVVDVIQYLVPTAQCLSGEVRAKLCLKS